MKNDEMRAFFVRHYTLLLPFVLSCVLGISVYSVYMISPFSVWTLGVAAVCAAVFAFCEFVNRHRFIGGLLLTVIIFFALSVFFRLIAGNDYGSTFNQWLLTGADMVTTRFEYLLALLVSFVPFFAVVVYYFTNILYRMSFLTLVSLIPCALYVKVLSEIDNVFICLIALLNVAVLLIHLRKEQSENARTVGIEASVLGVCVFSFVLLVISSAIPKESDARYYDRFEELFMDSNRNIDLGDNYSLFSDFSGGADSYRNFSNRRMYTLYGENAPYFKRQTFDYYDFANDRWYADEYYSEPYYTAEEWEYKSEKLNLGSLRLAMLAADGYEEEFIEEYGLSRLAAFDTFSDPVRDIYVYAENFGAMYYLSPARAISVRLSVPGEQIYVTRSGVFRNRLSVHERNAIYTVRLYDEYMSRFYWFELGGADFDSDSSLGMLQRLADILYENGDPLFETAEAFIEIHNEAEEYKSITEENTRLVSDEIRELALLITADCTYDWEKANALQQYFILNDYIYDLEYISADTSPEYFLFESKRGSCSDYASAYVLMARSLGLAARYAEGYSPNITSREGVFTITDSTSHAYPEVYIENMGWVVFEPTVPSDYSQITDDDSGLGGNIAVDYDLIFVMCIVAGIALAGALIFIVVYPAISERLFLKRAAGADAGRCAVMLYNRLVSRYMTSVTSRPEANTPFENAHVFMSMADCDISSLSLSVEVVAYGGKDIGEDERTRAFECYSSARTALKEYRRQRNKERRNRKK